MTHTYPLQVLLVDDDGNIRRTLALSLKDLSCITEQASSVEEAIIKFHSKPFDLVLTDFKMEKQNGLELIKQVKLLQPDALVVVMTAFASFENAVEVIKEGAFDYLPKPFTNTQLSHLLSKVREIIHLRRENLELKRSKARKNYFSGCTSPASQRLEEFVRKVAPTDGSILLTGESGTGKSELAKLIHELSPRAKQPFVTIYCTTLAESLLESELFGHTKGAFTGALTDKIGKLELADSGTLFLDEVGDLTPNGQTKLLRFLQDRIFEKVGSNKEITVDTRVIAATNKNLMETVASGKFREDLYYRLNVLECIVVPLRHRKEDLPILIERISGELTRGKSPPKSFPPAILDALLRYQWPGNIRELRNAIERLLMLSQGREALLLDLPDAILRPTANPSETSEIRSLEEIEKQHIQLILSKTENLEKAAEILGITTVTLWRKRKEYGIQ